jgi:hypothetical protein
MGRGRTTTGMVCGYIYFYMSAQHLDDSTMLEEHEKNKKPRRASNPNLNSEAANYLDGNYKYAECLCSHLDFVLLGLYGISLILTLGKTERKKP